MTECSKLRLWSSIFKLRRWPPLLQALSDMRCQKKKVYRCRHLCEVGITGTTLCWGHQAPQLLGYLDSQWIQDLHDLHADQWKELAPSPSTDSWRKVEGSRSNADEPPGDSHWHDLSKCLAKSTPSSSSMKPSWPYPSWWARRNAAHVESLGE